MHPNQNLSIIQLLKTKKKRFVGAAAPYLRLRERGRMWGEQRPPSSSVMLSVLPKCLDKKWSSSMVGWKGSWCSRSCEELEDWNEGIGRERGWEVLANQSRKKWKYTRVGRGLGRWLKGRGVCRWGRETRILSRVGWIKKSGWKWQKTYTSPSSHTRVHVKQYIKYIETCTVYISKNCSQQSV